MSAQAKALKGESLKQEVLKTALRHFALKGFAAANMDEIAEELGINKPSIYYHIGKKEVLFDIVINKAIDDHLCKLEFKLSQAISVEDKLLSYVGAFAENLSGENRYLANLILRQLATEDAYFPKSALEKMNTVQQHLLRIIEQGQSDRIFKQDANPFVIHMLIVGFFTVSATSGVMQDKFSEAIENYEMQKYSITLSETTEIIYNMLIDALRISSKTS